jgi:hypothetical protein
MTRFALVTLIALVAGCGKVADLKPAAANRFRSSR